MKTIPEQYKGRADQKGYTFTLEHRSSHGVVVYSKEKHGDVTYEVSKVRKHKKDVSLGGKLVYAEGDEYLPGSREWGTYGWTYRNMEDAMDKVEELEASNEND